MGGKDSDGSTLSLGDDAAPADGDFPVVDARCYDLEEEVARGGWGRIFRAFDRRLGRTVAIKRLRVSSALVEARLQREARLTARLEHPAIVPVHEVGRFAGGEPFYAMKLVEGRSLADVLAAAATLDERLPLVVHVLAVADAVAYAHARGVIHRDLKPSNVMIGAFGETVVIDWGLAKEVGAPEPDPDGRAGGGSPELTLAGSVVGSPPYLAPEQARGEPADERADVYALGAMLYAVIAGRGPYDGASADDILRRIIAEPAPALERREPTAPRDLVAIATRAMARDPARRYPSARSLADDLRRFLAGNLVAARRYPWPVLLARWLRRHRRGVAGAAVAALVLALLVGANRLRRERAVAEARRAELLLTRARTELDRDPTRTVALLKRYAASGGADRDQAELVAAEAESRIVARSVVPGMSSARLSGDGRVLAGYAGDRVRLLQTETGALREWVDPDGEVSRVRFTPDGARLLTVEKPGSLRVWDVAAGTSARLLRSDAPLLWLEPGPDGRFAAVTDTAGQVYRVELATGAVLARRYAGKSGLAVYSPDGHRLAVTGDGPVLVFRDDELAPATLPEPGADYWLAFAPDSARLAWSTRDGELVLHDLARGSQRVVGNQGSQVMRLAFTPDGTRLAAVSLDGAARLWDLATGTAQALSPPREATATRLAVSPDGGSIAVGWAKGQVELYDLATGGARPLRGHTHEMVVLEFARDGATLVSSDWVGETRLWPVAAPPARPVAARTARGAFGDGDGAIAMLAGSRIDVWDATAGAARRIELPGPAGPRIAVSPDGRHAATLSGSSVLLADLAGGEVRAVATRVSMRALALAPDGRSFAVSGDDCVVWLMGAGAPRELRGQQQWVQLLLFSPDGRQLLSSSTDGVVVWRVDGSQQRPFAPGEFVAAAAFAPDGRRVALAAASGHTWLWSPGDGAPRELVGHGAGVNQLVFSPDGATLASAGDDQAVWLWDAGGAGRRLPHAAAVRGLTFLGDGGRLASASSDGAVRIWEVATARELSVVHVADGPLDAVSFSGGALFAVDAEHLWRVTPPAGGHASLDAMTTAVLQDDDAVATVAARR